MADPTNAIALDQPRDPIPVLVAPVEADTPEDIPPPEDDQYRRSRASFRTPGRRSSRSGSRVSIERNSQTQQEVNEATQKIRNTEGGIPLCAYFKWLTDSTGQVVDLTAVANNIDLELERVKINNLKGSAFRTQALPDSPPQCCGKGTFEEILHTDLKMTPLSRNFSSCY